MDTEKDEEAILHEEFLYTHKDGLIAPAKRDVPSVEFSNDDAVRECRIWEGYLDASCLLLERAVKQWSQENRLIFPALFNLRHAMEVALKWHIKYAGGVVPKRAGHNLGILIDAFRDVTANFDKEENFTMRESLLASVAEIASLDPRAVAFRYSSEHDGSPIMITPEAWDIRALYFAVSDLSVIFDDLANRIERSWLQVDQNCRCE